MTDRLFPQQPDSTRAAGSGAGAASRGTAASGAAPSGTVPPGVTLPGVGLPGPSGTVRRAWRLTGTALSVALAGLLLWHVFNGNHGLSVWHQKRLEDRQLRKEIEDYQQENDRLRARIERLRSDPQTIGREARQSLHYVSPNEVIVTLPPERKTAKQ